MGRALLTINGDVDRRKASLWVAKAPPGTRITFAASKRSTDQNSKLWACLTDVAEQVEWHGLKLTPNDWKTIFMDGLNRELRMVPSIDGKGFVNLGRSSSKLSKQEFSDLIELIHMFGANHGVKFHDDAERAA